MHKSLSYLAVAALAAAGCAGDPVAAESAAVRVGNFDVRASVDQDWGTGFCASVAIRNEGTSDPGDWSVELDLDCGVSISSLWNGAHTRQGRTLHVDATWNKSLPPGATAQVGFCGTGRLTAFGDIRFYPGGGKSAAPTACDGTAPPPAPPADMATPPAPPPPPPSTGGGLPARVYSGYYQSWSEPWKASGADAPLAKLPAYVNVVNLSFMRPDASYAAGSFSLGGTGLDFPYDGPTLRDAVRALKAKNPGTKVTIAVGGATYPSWAAVNVPAIAAFVRDFGLDGVDIDYEPSNPGCAASGGTVRCASDAELIRIVGDVRRALPRPLIVSIAAWSVGAYGEGAFATAPPQGSPYMGMMLALFRSPQANDLDLVNVMSYDASPAFDPVQALTAYQQYFKGAIAMGVEVPPEAWGGHVYDMAQVEALADAVNVRNARGMMLWSLQKKPNGAPSPSNPDAQMMSTAICRKLALPDCTAPLFP